MKKDGNSIAPRKAWTTPTLRRLSAGSAEAGSGTLGDGGGPGANRS
jgi:hypothetical protein